MPPIAVMMWFPPKTALSKPSNIYHTPRQMSTSPTTIEILRAKYAISFISDSISKLLKRCLCDSLYGAPCGYRAYGFSDACPVKDFGSRDTGNPGYHNVFALATGQVETPVSTCLPQVGAPSPPHQLFFRDTGNRTQSPRTRSVCTTGILCPDELVWVRGVCIARLAETPAKQAGVLYPDKASKSYCPLLL